MKIAQLGVAALVSLIATACTADPLGAPHFNSAKLDADVRASVGTRVGGPPGSVVFYSSREGAPSKIYLMNPDGTAQQRVTSGAGADIWPDISQNGRYIAFTSNRSGNNEIWVLELATGDLVNVSKPRRGCSSSRLCSRAARTW